LIKENAASGAVWMVMMMPLVNMSELLQQAMDGNWAVGSFSVANMEMVLGILKAAEETESPVILQIAEVRLKHSPLEMIGPLMVSAAENAEVPVAVHFDHGTTVEAIEQALDLGFTSVMIDGSKLELKDNMAITRKVVKLAREYGADVEGEIGSVGGSEDGSEHIAIHCTSPEEALQFQNATGVDALAVAIGNAHGNYTQEPKLRFDILEQVSSLLDVPLVLHGGTGISPDDFKKCIKFGIKKINIATATFDAVEQSVRAAYESGKISGYYDLQTAEVEGAYQNALKHIEIFGSAGKC
jgi:fructose-bisphosphate aldolase, class II